MATIHKYSKGIIIQYSTVQANAQTPGSVSDNISSKFELLDENNLSWIKKSNLNYARSCFNIHYFDGLIFALCGTDGSIFHKTIEVYDTFSDTWTLKKSAPYGKCFYQSCIIGHEIYIIGGLIIDALGNISISNTIEKYDIYTDTWKSLKEMPTPVALGICHNDNDNIYVLSGFKSNTDTPNDLVYSYNISSNTWSSISLESNDIKSLYKRVLPFYFKKDNYIYVLNGYLYERTVNSTSESVITNVTENILQDSYRFNTTTKTIERADQYFYDLPKARYGGCSVSNSNLNYFIGGINKNTNTIKQIDVIDDSSNPFIYADYTRLNKGRSVFGSTISTDEYSGGIYVAGGVESNFQENFLYVMLDALSKNVKLNNKETAAIQVVCVDENGEYPKEVNVQLTGTNITGEAVLLTNDIIKVKNGKAIATLLPRSEDVVSGSLNVTDKNFENYYFLDIKGSIIDSFYFGESESNIQDGGNSSGGSGGGNIGGVPKLSLPPGVDLLKEYKTIIIKNQQNQFGFVNSGIIANVVNLQSFNKLGSNQDVSLKYYNNQSWLPLTKARLDLNSSTYEDLYQEILRMSKENVFGGSALLDSIDESLDLFELDVTSDPRLLYILSDGNNNTDYLNGNDIISRIDSITGQKKFPIVSSKLNIVPNNMALAKGIRSSSLTLNELAKETEGSVINVITESDVEKYSNETIKSQGFIGSGRFLCTIDLGEDVKIDHIKLNFEISSAEVDANWKYAIGNSEYSYSNWSEKNGSDETVVLNDSIGQFIKLDVLFLTNIDSDSYNGTKIVPPKLKSIEITYNKKTTSYVFFEKIHDENNIHQVAISIDTEQSEDSSVLIGVNTEDKGDWNSYQSGTQPALSNDNKIIIPIRMQTSNRDLLSLENLVYVDGFLFEAKYGKWASNSEVNVYNVSGKLIPKDEYRSFPEKGYIVFNYRTLDNYIIEIKNKKELSVAAQITNNIYGKPAIIHGAGYFYSTLENRFLNNSPSKILPEAINTIITPISPDKNSVFTAHWTFFDLKGRNEKNSILSWFINDKEQIELKNIKSWDNKKLSFANSGDVIYFTILPRASDDTTGILIKSVPVKLL